MRKEGLKNHKISHRIVFAIMSFFKGVVGAILGLSLMYLSLMTFFLVKEPLNYIAGIPIFSFGFTIFIFSIHFFKEGTFDVIYTRINCPFCKNPIKIKNHSLVLACKNCGHDITIKK